MSTYNLLRTRNRNDMRSFLLIVQAYNYTTLTPQRMGSPVYYGQEKIRFSDRVVKPLTASQYTEIRVRREGKTQAQGNGVKDEFYAEGRMEKKVNSANGQIVTAKRGLVLNIKPFPLLEVDTLNGINSNTLLAL